MRLLVRFGLTERWSTTMLKPKGPQRPGLVQRAVESAGALIQSLRPGPGRTVPLAHGGPPLVPHFGSAPIPPPTRVASIPGIPAPRHVGPVTSASGKPRTGPPGVPVFRAPSVRGEGKVPLAAGGVDPLRPHAENGPRPPTGTGSTAAGTKTEVRRPRQPGPG